MRQGPCPSSLPWPSRLTPPPRPSKVAGARPAEVCVAQIRGHSGHISSPRGDPELRLRTERGVGGLQTASAGGKRAAARMAGVTAKSFDAPDKAKDLPGAKAAVCELGDGRVASKICCEPGWKWSKCIKPIAGTECDPLPSLPAMSTRCPPAARAPRPHPTLAPGAGGVRGLRIDLQMSVCAPPCSRRAQLVPGGPYRLLSQGQHDRPDEGRYREGHQGRRSLPYSSRARRVGDGRRACGGHRVYSRGGLGQVSG